ncbi:MAG: AtpZ/AtpI family protein [Gammaproteobacteria bacterium]|jgi:ATP synthase protein I
MATDPKDDKQQLQQRIDKQVERLKKAERDRPTLLAQTTYIGTLGLLFVLPVVAGAYLGRWLDSMMAGYSLRWTLSMIFLGLVVGAVNVYLYVRE